MGPRGAGTPGGYAHIALALAQGPGERGVPVVSGPRLTGDGYYESVVQDPDGNQIELCA